MLPTRMSSRPALRATGALTITLLLAGSVTACGSGDDATSTTTGASAAATTGATGASTTASSGAAPTGGAPAANEAAIRAALGRSTASTKTAKTARISVEQSTAGITSKSTGTIDLVDQRFLLDQTLGDHGAGKGLQTQTYGEKGKVYIRTQFEKGWSVTDNPVQVSDPLAQVRQLAKAKIVEVGTTSTYGGRTCRNFDAEIGIADALGVIDDPSFKAFLEDAPKDAKIPVSSCVDDAGLSYASESSYELADVLGPATASKLGKLANTTSTSKILVTDYGTAAAPVRPPGIDDAKPLGAGLPSGASSGTGTSR